MPLSWFWSASAIEATPKVLGPQPGTDMVALNKVDLSSKVEQSMRAGKEPEVKKFNPRFKGGVGRWEIEVKDLLSYHELYEVAAKGLPTLDECREYSPVSDEFELKHGTRSTLPPLGELLVLPCSSGAGKYGKLHTLVLRM